MHPLEATRSSGVPESLNGPAPPILALDLFKRHTDRSARPGPAQRNHLRISFPHDECEALQEPRPTERLHHVGLRQSGDVRPVDTWNHSPRNQSEQHPLGTESCAKSERDRRLEGLAEPVISPLDHLKSRSTKAQDPYRRIGFSLGNQNQRFAALGDSCQPDPALPASNRDRATRRREYPDV